MIFNSTYTDKKKELEAEKLIGKKYSLFNSIRFNGVGSKRLIIEETSLKFKKIIIQKNDLIYSNIELRPKGIIVYIAEGLNRFFVGNSVLQIGYIQNPKLQYTLRR